MRSLVVLLDVLEARSILQSMKGPDSAERPKSEFEQHVNSAQTIKELRALKAEVESLHSVEDSGKYTDNTKYMSEMRIIGARAMHVFAHEAESAKTHEELDGIAKDAEDFFGTAGRLDTSFLNSLYAIVGERIRSEKERIGPAIKPLN